MKNKKINMKVVLLAFFVLLAIGSDDTVGRISAGTGEVNAVEELRWNNKDEECRSSSLFYNEWFLEELHFLAYHLTEY